MPITDYVNNNKGCSLNDICKNVTDNLLSKPTVCRVLKDLKINNYLVCKDINLIEKERKEYAIKNATNINTFNESISIDESGFKIEDLIKKGYSLQGESINKLIKHKHNKLHYNLLMAISNKKIIAYEISKESVNK